MKKILIFGLIVLCSFAARSQCFIAPIYAYWTHFPMMVGDTLTMLNANVGGTWSVNDTNLALIDPTTGFLTAKTIGVPTVTYNMPGACRLFFSVRDMDISSGIDTPSHIPVCGSGTVFDSVISAATWSSADTSIAKVGSTTGIVRGISAGTVMLTCNFMSGHAYCTTYKPVKITTGITGRRRLYIGDTATYSDTVAGGTWHVTDSSIAAIDGTTGFVRAKSAGMTTVTYLNTVAGNVCTAVDTIKVGFGIQRHPHICISDSVYYTDSVSGGSWSSADPSVASINSTTGLMRSLATGNTVISYTLTTMGTTFYITDSVQVTTAPTITSLGPLHFCGGVGDTLRVSSTPVTWSSDDPYLFPIDSYSGVFWTRADTLSTPLTTVVRYSAISCSYIKDTSVVSVNPNPAIGRILGTYRSICAADTVMLTNPTAPGGTWVSYYATAATVDTVGIVTGLAVPYSQNAYIGYTTVNSYGCSNGTEFSVYVLGVPDPGTITGVSSLNMGLIGNYSAVYTYPDYTSASHDAWSISPSSIASVSSTGQVTPLSVGTAVIKHFFTNSCSTDSVSRTITITPPVSGAVSSTFTGYVNRYCAAPQFGVSVFPHTSPYTLRTYYGDGTFDTLTLAATTAVSLSSYYHTYGATGNYSIKQALYNGSAGVDSVTYSYLHLDCNNISLSFFQDVDHDCIYSSSVDHINYSSVRVEVDSNGVVIDTIPAISGLYYQEYGSVGDVYSFRLISPSIVLSCPSSGIFLDTIKSSSTAVKNFSLGVSCTSSAFDVKENAVVSGTGRHYQSMIIHTGNAMCTPENASLTVNFDSHFTFYGASIYPSSTSGTTLTWNLSGISDISGTHPDIKIELWRPGSSSSWLTPGTPIYTSVAITPSASGDIDTTNNHENRVDTVLSSYDPNRIEVSPSGNILNGTKLHYTIEFENDGNDTARNIFVMDTLPDYVNVSSLEMVMATALVNTSLISSGGHNIIKFDFPNINLPDSSDHMHCRGAVMFNVNAKRSLADGTSIINHAGIFFDDNPVVLTDTAYNTIVIPSLTVSGPNGDTICHGRGIHCMAVPHSVNNNHYQWYFNNAPAGTDSIGYSNITAVAGDSIKCKITAIMDDTARAVSNTLHLHDRPIPYSGVIYGPSTVCQGSTITLTDSVPGGVWNVFNANASVTSTGIVTGVAGGSDTIYYGIVNVCGTYNSGMAIIINPTLYPSVTVTATPSTPVCEGDSVMLSATYVNGGASPSFYWDKMGTSLGSGLSVNYVPAIGDIVVCRMTSNALCRSTDTVYSPYTAVGVTPAVTPAVSIVASPSDTVTAFGALVTFYPTATYGGTSPLFQWYLDGSAVTGATSSSFSCNVYPGDQVSCAITSNAYCVSTTHATSNVVVMHGDYLGVHQVTGTIQGLTIFPNPNTGNFTLSGKVPGGNKELRIEIREVTGKLVYNGVISTSAGAFSEQLNLDNLLAPGQYFAKIIGERDDAVVQFTVK